MNVVFVASEAVPFAKTGGLGDVAGALPRALAKLGHSVALFLPCYRRVWSAGVEIVPTGHHPPYPDWSHGRSRLTLYESRLPGSNVAVYLIDQPRYFDRDGLYGADGKDYEDNCERFVFFDRAVLEAIRALHLRPDVIHCNDWQTGLIPVYLKTVYQRVPELRSAGTLLTIHNLAYLGLFPHWDMALTGSGVASLQLAAAGVPRQALLHEGRPGVCRHAQHGEPNLRPGDPDAPVGIGAGRAASLPTGRSAWNRQRDRHRSLEPEQRADAGGAL